MNETITIYVGTVTGYDSQFISLQKCHKKNKGRLIDNKIYMLYTYRDREREV